MIGQVSKKDNHEVETVSTTFGWKAKCSCGTYTLGFFTSAAHAKKAMMNSSHPEDKSNG